MNISPTWRRNYCCQVPQIQHTLSKMLSSLAWRLERVGINDCGKRRLLRAFFIGETHLPLFWKEASQPRWLCRCLGTCSGGIFSLLSISDIYSVASLNALLCSNLCVGSESWMEFQPQIASNWAWNQTETQTQFRWVLMPWMYHCVQKPDFPPLQMNVFTCQLEVKCNLITTF